jgi:glyoxylase-like metal-dependent hydrolase (beta-lactamase superfamily II)
MKLESLTVSLFQENCYIVGDENVGEGILIDPGDEASRIALAVENTGLEIGRIIITHPHIDHVGAVAELAEEYSCPVLMHPEGEEMLDDLPSQAMMMGVRLGSIPQLSGHVEDGQRIRVGGITLEALYTPGHCPGHVAFYCESEGMLFSGDTLFAGGIGRTDLPGGEMETLMHSIQERLLTLPEDTRVYTGHGAPTTIGEEKAHNPFLHGGML